MEAKKLISTGLIIMALAVVTGAFGAHIVQDQLSEHYFDIYKTAVQYQFIHGLGLTIVMMYLDIKHYKNTRWIAFAFLFGIICFCGSLYIISFNEVLEMPGLRKFGAVAPIGGVGFIVAWVLSARAVWKSV